METDATVAEKPEFLTLADCFPLPQPREKQSVALDFIQRAAARGYTDIVISAPTGVGKTGIGVAACLWGNRLSVKGEPGGYYLVTQKLLQTQLENDLNRYRDGCRDGASVKSAAEYACPTYHACSVGLTVPKDKRRCNFETCAYRLAREKFLQATVAITNYPYFLTERTRSGKFPARRVLVCDECHTLERQLLRFVDLTVSEATLADYAPEIDKLPNFENLAEFTTWLRSTYLASITSRAETLHELAVGACGTPDIDALVKQAFKLDQHVAKVERALELLETEPKDWIFWASDDAQGKREYTARPLNAAPFRALLTDMGAIRIYLSAYPGSKAVFCRSLGLDPQRVAWCALKSPFPVKNRQIFVINPGSMSRKYLEQTWPTFSLALRKLFDLHAGEKGLVHCHSYALAQRIFDDLQATRHAPRLIFPKTADDREPAFQQHAQSPEPTVILTPSMAEGFNFEDNLARWQVVAKVPYPSLGDRHVVAKKDQDPSWYKLETIKTVIQACGRIVRSETDYGATYILDGDFEYLYRECETYFPAWFVEALIWVKKPSVL